MSLASDALRWVGLMGVVGGALARASVSMEPLPYWDLNPLQVWAPSLAVGPAGSLALDALIVACAGLGLLGEALAGRRVRGWMGVLLGAGVVGVALHGLVLHGRSLDDLRIGSSWAAAVAGAVALAHLGRDERVARIGAAAMVGFVAMLAARGAVQVLVEHPRTVADYEANREAMLAARGWSPDSMMARTFERRLMQPEATGWFGLANVYASIAAGAGVALAGLTVLGWRGARRKAGRIADGYAGLVTLGALAGVGALWMSHSRGGVVAFLVGLVLLGAGWAGVRLVSDARRRMAFGAVMGVGVVGAVLAGVVARGVVGERLGELSILFRWFYMEGALRIFAAHPLLGVGPDGFKGAYLLAKPGLSPEEVSSPHSVMLEWAATLGVFGVAWAGLFLGLCCACGRALVSGREEAVAEGAIGGPGRTDAWVVVGLAAAATLLSAWVEAAGATAESAGGRMAGLAAWAGVGLGVLVVSRGWRAWRWCLAGGALALAAHAQIEVSATWSGSAALVLAMIGLGASGSVARESGAGGARGRVVGLSTGVGLVVAAVVIAGLGAAPAWRWERSLERGAALAGEVASYRSRLLALGPTGRSGSGDSLMEIARDLSGSLGAGVEPSGPGVMAGLGELTRRRVGQAVAELDVAIAVFPGHAGTRQAASRLLMDGAAAEAPGPAREALLEEAERRAEAVVEGDPGSAAGWGWLATVRRTAWEARGDRGALVGAVAAWTRAHELDPNGLVVVERLVWASEALGDSEGASGWASEALSIDERLRLDPLRRLTDEERAAMRALAGED